MLTRYEELVKPERDAHRQVPGDCLAGLSGELFTAPYCQRVFRHSLDMYEAALVVR